MSVRVTVSLEAGGLVAVKTAATPGEIARLHDEVARLRRLHHPGVVTLVDNGPTPRGVAMRTVYAGDPVERWRGALPRAAGVGAVVAATLADLHDMGVVHGRLDASHVLIGPDGRPRLCGLSDPGAATPADDVRGLGELVTLLIERSTARRGGHRQWPLRPRAEQRALHHVARRALDPVPSRRPSARALSRAILTAVPEAALPAASIGSGGTDRPPAQETRRLSMRPAAQMRPRLRGRLNRSARRPVEPGPTPLTRTGPPRREVVGHGDSADAVAARRTALGVGAAGVAALALIVGGAVALRGTAATVNREADTGADTGIDDRRAGISDGRVNNSEVGGSGRGTGGRGRASDESSGTSSRCGDVVQPAADGDGCRDAVRVDGRTVAVGAARWRLGEPGDVVAVGRWDCGGSVFPALLRPATGDVFVFWRWAPHGQAVTAEPIERVAGATSIRAEPTADGCDQLVVDRDGDNVVIEVVRP